MRKNGPTRPFAWGLVTKAHWFPHGVDTLGVTLPKGHVLTYFRRPRDRMECRVILHAERPA